MEFRARRRPVAVEDDSLRLDVQLYSRPPSGPVALADFERVALDRLRVLRALSQVAAQTKSAKGEEWRSAALERLRREGLKRALRSCTRGDAGADAEEERADALSHFALRLAYCRSEELRRWFVARELELFRLRFAALTPREVEAFLAREGLRYEPLGADERARLESELAESTAGSSNRRGEFYAVEFAQVLDSVARRRALVRGGRAYVPAEELSTAIASRFRARLFEALARAAARLPRLEVDERLAPILRGLPDSYSGNSYESSRSAFPIDRIDAIAEDSFPPCMRRLHSALRRDHHLKHGGRLQYGLFLKAVGVSLEDALGYFRDEFSKKVGTDKFDKQYAYNVRYNYGKEGSRKNYSPFSCTKIVLGNVGPGDYHGCAFKHSDATALKSELTACGLSAKDVSEICELASKGHYQIACSKYFDAKHHTGHELNIIHPNQYFEASKGVLSGNFKGIVVPKSENVDNQACEPMDDWNNEAVDEMMKDL